ncbi:HSPB1-associated protein 1 isoform X2 [Heteronotia binoei]|uniref:HSPB1-associated protein 1 isoform X2 n=1 Tax=Heteronotia binoei TaxID=13085 RepID=UPI00292D424E|nr:HSPB1-associated protein 1 isoform X2 [Heteronotia binoei]
MRRGLERFCFRNREASEMAGNSTATLALSQPGEEVKPFTPGEAKEIVMSLQEPAVFCNMACDWPALHWNVTYLAKLLAGKRILFRMGMKDMGTAPLFETKCSYVEATLEEFLAWSLREPSCSSGPFSGYESCKYWAYADYKYIASLFEDNPEEFKDVRWSDFGFSGRDGRESTLWVGTSGANTPCHLDSYGCNLVLQVQGRKRWHLYPPEDSSFLYPTRIPYEESSVFSKVNVVNPDLKCFPQFKKAQTRIVTVNPGQILFVPRHWWHYVESIDPITDTDHEARVEEAITRTLICAIKSADHLSTSDSWLNPTETDVTSHKTNLQYLNAAVSGYLEHQKLKKTEHRVPGTPNTEETFEGSHKRRKVQMDADESFKLMPCEANLATIKTKKLEKIPFGQNLLKVLLQSQQTNPTETVESDFKDFLRENEGHLEKPHCAGTTSVTNNNSGAVVDQKDPSSTASSTRAGICTNDLLDCVLSPQVVSIVARLLLERARLA